MHIRRAAILALLVVLAGCTGAPSDPGPTGSTTGAGTPAATATGTGTPAVTATTSSTTGALHVSPVVDYETLSAESRADFDRVLAQGAVEAEEPMFAGRIADANYNLIRIRFEGRIVEIRHQRRQDEARTCLEGVTRVDESRIGDDADVRAYANLSAEGAALFRSVLDGNASDTCFSPSEYPLDANHVRYQGQLYSLSEVQATEAIYVYRVRTE